MEHKTFCERQSGYFFYARMMEVMILDNGKNHDILVLMPAGAKKMEQFKAIQVANEIRDEDHGGGEEVIICGKKVFIFL